MRRPLVIFGFVVVVAAVGLAVTTFSRGNEANALVERAAGRLGVSLAEAPRWEEVDAAAAHEELEQAVTLGRTDAATRGLLQIAATLIELAREDSIGAETELRAARALLGSTADVLTLQAEIETMRGDAERARHCVAEALRLDAHHPRALLLAAELALERTDVTAATDLANRLKTETSGAAIAWDLVGRASEARGDLVIAEESFRAAIARDDGLMGGWIHLGGLLLRAERYAEAMEAFNGALGRSPADPDALLGRGLVWAALGDRAHAEQDLRRAAEVAPSEADALVALGDICRTYGEIDAAIARYRQGLERQGDHALGWLKLGNALVERGESGAAVTAFRQAIRQLPELAAAHNGLGVALMGVGSLTEAETSLERAAELDPEDPNPARNLILVRTRLSNVRTDAGHG